MFLRRKHLDDQYDPKVFSDFLFSVVNKPGWEPVKLPQTGENSAKQQFLVEAFVIFGIIAVLVSFRLQLD